MKIGHRLAVNLCVLATVVGAFAGLLVPKSTSAVSLYNVYVHPTADTLTCGWHGGACWDYPTYVPSGWALDWRTILAGSSFNVYFFVKSDNWRWCWRGRDRDCPVLFPEPMLPPVERPY